MTTYGNNFYGFGSPEAYAKAIKDKEYSGKTLSDPAAAAKFKQEHSYLFPEVGVRDYLSSKGITDVGYNNGFVTVNGQNLLVPQYNQNRTTFDTKENIDSALSRIGVKSPYETPEYKSPYADQIGSALGKVTNPAPYTSPYANDIASSLNAIQNRQAFNYDPNSDAGLQAAQTNAMDAVSRAAARRGMIYSDSNKAQMGQAAMQLVPQFRNQAYGEYQGENARLSDILSQLMGIENMNYGQYRDSVGDNYNVLQALAGLDDSNYGRYRNTIADTRYIDETKYTRGRNAYLDQLKAIELEQKKDKESNDMAIAIAKLMQGQELSPYHQALIDNMNFDNNLALEKYLNPPKPQAKTTDRSKLWSGWQKQATTLLGTRDLSNTKGLLDANSIAKYRQDTIALNPSQKGAYNYSFILNSINDAINQGIPITKIYQKLQLIGLQPHYFAQVLSRIPGWKPGVKASDLVKAK